MPWKITIFNGNIHYKWPFSIAMLVHQRLPGLAPGEAARAFGLRLGRHMWVGGTNCSPGGGQQKAQPLMGEDGLLLGCCWFKVSHSYGHLLVITGYKWDYTFYKWGYKYLSLVKGLNCSHKENVGIIHYLI